MAESRFRGKKCSKWRTRYHCQYCQQSLGYSVFRRHKDLPSTYCPGVSSTRTNYEHESESTDSLDSTFVSPATRTCMSSQENNHVSAGFENNGLQMLSTSSEGQGSTDSNCDPEVWDENGMHSSDSDDTNQAVDMHGETVSNLQYIVCLFLTFFQLCFHVSDKAVSHLFTFLSSLFTYLSSNVKDNTMLVLFSKSFPTTLALFTSKAPQSQGYLHYVCSLPKMS